ncbi:MAG: DUF6338 family protein [Candidatus Sumerlaeota bacterium]|nr:DUF6338 family protein [Candidatus Sumerlaeota bacterium]
MEIWQTDKLLLFIAFVIPGFISLKVYELLHPGILKDPGKQLIDAVAYSCVNYALLFWPIHLVESSALVKIYPNIHVAFCVFVILIAPIIWVILWSYIRTRKILLKVVHHPTQKPWDYVFSKREPYWIKIFLKDGTKIGGKYAGKSFTSSAPAEEQIYLEETWILNDKGGLERPKKRTAGVIITSKEISYIELMKYREETHK